MKMVHFMYLQTPPVWGLTREHFCCT
uniref:Uncharacterized protein n=1 Tax=Anguilla anguilla TaxID=7936 RepID=A0A0E9Y1A4_ANGAN